MSFEPPKTLHALLDALISKDRCVKVSTLRWLRQQVKIVLSIYCRGSILDSAAEDIGQLVIEDLLKRRDKPDHHQPAAHIKKIALHRLFDEFRRRRVRVEAHQTLAVTSGGQQAQFLHIDAVLMFFSAAMQDELHRWISSAIDAFETNGGSSLDVERLRQCFAIETGSIAKQQVIDLVARERECTNREAADLFRRQASNARGHLIASLDPEVVGEDAIEYIKDFLRGKTLKKRKIKLDDPDQKAWAEDSLSSIWARLDPIGDLIDVDDFPIPGVDQLQIWPRAGVLMLRGVAGPMRLTGDVAQRDADLLLRSRTTPCAVELIDLGVMIEFNGDQLQVRQPEASDAALPEAPPLDTLLGQLVIDDDGRALFEQLYASESNVDRWIAAACVARFGSYFETNPGTAPRPLPGAILYAIVKQWPAEMVTKIRLALQRRAESLQAQLSAISVTEAKARDALESLQTLISWATDSDEINESLAALDRAAQNLDSCPETDDLLLTMARLTAPTDGKERWWL